MSACSLNSILLLFLIFIHASSKASKLNMDDLQGFAELVQKGNGNIGSLTPTTKSLSLPDLSPMMEALKPLEGKLRSKRQAEKQGEQLNDEALQNTKIEVDSVSKTIGMPLGKKGNPAFSIHANTVYILYPSLFQDPNIFGRFSIPQNINMDKNVMGNDTTVPGKPEVLLAPSENPPLQPPQPPASSRKGRRSADAPPTPPPKRNVESHLSGTIVVQNQDVNEYNKRDSY